MPDVNGKKYPYTEVGVNSAIAEAKRTGQEVEGLPTNNAQNRKQAYAIDSQIPGQKDFGVNANPINNVQDGVAINSPVSPSEDDVEEIIEEEV